MKTLNLEFDCESVNITPGGYSNNTYVKATCNGVHGIDLDTKEIAENVSIRTMIEGHSVTDILDYLYDEHLEELKDFVKENKL